jgi:hypothetical protein
MDNGAEKMESVHFKSIPLKSKSRSSSAIQTTLYELMEAVIDVADPDENRLVNEVTINMLAKAKPSVHVSVR